MTSQRFISTICLLALAAAAQACGSHAPTTPVLSGQIPVVVNLNIPSGGSSVDSIFSLRVDVRDTAGAAVGAPFQFAVPAGQTSFSFQLETAIGQDRVITVLALGSRLFAGGPDGTGGGDGVLYRGTVTN